MPPIVYLKQFGCPTMKSFEEELSEELSGRGFLILDTNDNSVLGLGDDFNKVKEADVCIFYLCGIVSFCEQKILNYIKKVKSINKKAFIIITGCNFRKYIAHKQSFDLVTGQIDEIRSFLNREFPFNNPHLNSPNIAFPPEKSIIVKSCCDKFCTYCIEPFLRRESGYLNVYNSYKEIMDLVKDAQNSGKKSIRLTGLCIGDWKDKETGKGIKDLILGILKKTSLSINNLEFHPNDLSEGIIEILANERMGRQISIPIQSGSDVVLKRMNREYDISHVGKMLNLLYKNVPAITITTDIIVGFPGETNEDFMQTCDFITSFPFERVFIMRFNKRPGTKAASMANQVSYSVKYKRIKIISQQLNEQLIPFTIRDAQKRT